MPSQPTRPRRALARHTGHNGERAPGVSKTTVGNHRVSAHRHAHPSTHNRPSLLVVGTNRTVEDPPACDRTRRRPATFASQTRDCCRRQSCAQSECNDARAARMPCVLYRAGHLTVAAIVRRPSFEVCAAHSTLSDLEMAQAIPACSLVGAAIDAIIHQVCAG